MNFLRGIKKWKLIGFIALSLVVSILYCEQFKSKYNATDQLRNALDKHIFQGKAIEPMDVTKFTEYLPFPINEIMSIWPDKLELCLKNAIMTDKNLPDRIFTISTTTIKPFDTENFGLLRLNVKMGTTQTPIAVKMNTKKCFYIPSEKGKLFLNLENIEILTLLYEDSPMINVKSGSSELYVRVSMLTLTKLTTIFFLILSFVADSLVSIYNFYKK